MDGFFYLSPPFSSTKFLLFCLLLLFCRIATAQNFSLFPGRLLDFVNKREILILLSIGVEYQNEEGKYPHTTQRRGLSLLFSSLLFSPLSKHKEEEEEEESVASQIHTRTHHARHVNHNNDEYDGFVFLFCIDRDKKDDKLYEAKCDDDEKERYRSETGRNWCCCCGTTQTTSARKSRRNEYEQ